MKSNSVGMWAGIVLLVGFSTLKAEDWPQFRGLGSKGVSSETNLPMKWSKTEGLRWTAELPGRGLSCPVVAGGRVYITACSGYRENRLHVLCFDTTTGKKLWERQFTATGNTACHPVTCMAAPTPVADGENVYALFATGDLVALDREGTQLWYRSLVGDYPYITNQVGMAASPTLAGSTLILPMENAGDSFVAGIDTKTGKNRWKVKRDRDIIWVSPVVVTTNNKSVAVFHTGSEATAYDTETGKVRWSYSGEGLGTIPSSAANEGLVVVPGSSTVALKLNKDGTGAEALWKSGKLSRGYPSPVIYEGKVYGLAGVALNCVSARDGSDLWSQRLPGKLAASPVLGDGKAYVVNQEGVTTVVQLGEKPSIIAQNDLKDTFLATPAISGGALYLRSDKQLYCIGEKK